MNNMNNANWTERGGASRADMGLDLKALDGELRFLGIATKQALEPMVTPLINGVAGLAMGVGMIGDLGGRLLSTGRGRLVTSFLALTFAIEACSSPLSTRESSTGVAPSTTVATETTGDTTTETAVANPTSTEVPVVGYGGLPSAEQKAFMESNRAQEMQKGLENYVTYWEEFGVFAKGTKLSMVPYVDLGDPKNPDKMVYVAEVSGDPNYEGYVVTVPIAQYEKYLQTGDPETMLPPQGATSLQENTDPFKMSKQVKKDSIPNQAGIPVGAVNGVKDGQFVYFAPGTTGALEVVGHLDETFHWKAESTSNSIEKDLNLEYYDAHLLPLPEVLNLNGIDMKVKFGPDESIQSMIKSIKIHPDWTSAGGNTAEVAPAMFMQRVFYDVYGYDQKRAGIAEASIPDFDTWAGLVATAQASGKAEDYAKFAIDVMINDTTTDFKMEKIKVVPMFKEGGTLPAGTRPIYESDIVLVKGNRVENLQMMYESLSMGVGVNLTPDGKLVIYIAPAQNNPDTFAAQQVTGIMSAIVPALENGHVGPNTSGPSDLLNSVAKRHGQGYSAFFQITDPATEIEKSINR